MKVGKGYRMLIWICLGFMGIAGIFSECVFAREQTETIAVTYLYREKEPENLADIEEKVNAYIREKIPVQVRFVPVNLEQEREDAYEIMLAYGEKIDLLCFAYARIENYIREGRLLPLNDLLAKEGTDIQQYSEEYPIYDGCIRNEKIYGVSPISLSYGYQSRLLLKRNYWDELNIAEKDRYTWEELTEILKEIKHRHPDLAPVAILESDVSGTESLSHRFFPYDCLGSSVISGVLLNPQDTEIINLFESKQYVSFLRMIRKWYEEGLIREDALFCSADKSELFSQNLCVADVLTVKMESYPEVEKIMGGSVISLQASEGCYLGAKPEDQEYWTINAKSEHPEAAMRFLNLVYRDKDLMNLLCYGETQREKVDLEKARDRDNVFDCGNMTLRLDIAGEDGVEELRQWSEANLKKRYCSYGYCFDSSQVFHQMEQIRRVLERYLPAIETGSLENWEETYKEMLAQLKRAGIDEVIRLNQEQFDQWRQKRSRTDLTAD